MALDPADELEQLRQEYLAKLEAAAALTREEAKKLLLDELQADLADDIAKLIRQSQTDYTAQADQLAREIILDAMIHGATDYTAEYTVSTVVLPNENVKGSIIGKEGRNIAAFERATGVEMEIEEGTTLRLSSFDPIRREIARRALGVLIRDGRIQPARIEEVVAHTTSQMDHVLLEEGQKICQECGVNLLPPDLVKIIGRYRFRFSYGQNLALHTIEETKIGVQIAAELGLPAQTIQDVRLGCLLHDVGKVVTDEEGSHVQLGVDLVKKFSLAEPVIKAVAEHHEDRPFSSDVSRIVWVADAISGSRPGARYEPHETYVKRLEQIEDIGRSFAEVAEVYAFQAGRDVRVLVKPDQVSDAQLTVLVAKIRERLEKEAQYAGQIKITAIREVRTTDVTRAK